MTAQRHAVRHAIVLSGLMILLGSTAAAATKWVSADVSTEAIVTVQYFLCTLLCLPRILRPGIQTLRTERLGLHLTRGLAGVLSFYLFYATLHHIPMIDAMMLRQSAPLTVPLVVWIWTSEKVPSSTWLPLCLGFVGIAIILRPSPLGLSWWHAGGFLGALGLAISMVATRKLAATEPTARILFYYCVLSLVCVAPFSLGDFSGLTGLNWLALLYVGIAIYLVLELYTRAYGMAPTTAIAPITYFSVVLAGLWDWLFWNQMPDRWSLVGGVLVIAGGLIPLYLARNRRQQTRPSDKPPR
jgi:drug/metabolite transporter (DMT)-like permease